MVSDELERDLKGRGEGEEEEEGLEEEELDIQSSLQHTWAVSFSLLYLLVMLLSTCSFLLLLPVLSSLHSCSNKELGVTLPIQGL